MTLTMDIFATACDAAGVRLPANVDGVSFLAELRGEPSVGHREFYFVRREGGAAYGGKTIDALRRGDWKLLQDGPFKPLELYDLRSNPQEANDMSTKNRKVFKELSAALQKQLQRAGSVPWQPSTPSL
jgi:arylsulfatase A-like enzyme